MRGSFSGDSAQSLRRRLRESGAVIACLILASLSAPSFAQDVSTTVEEGGANGLNTNDIIVTARRQKERLQDVPVAVTALSSEALEQKGINNLEQIRTSVPSLQINPGPLGASIPRFAIRGQVQHESIIAQDTSVGVYYADVVLARPHGSTQSFYDIESVQVLKGPQGTLFGRNTTGGAVLITPKRPSFDFEGSLTGLVGTYNLYGGTAVLNIPVSDNFAIRAAGKVEYRDGYTHNLVTGRAADDENVEAGRIASLWKPTDTIESYTMFDFVNAKSAGTASKLVAVRAGSSAATLYPGLTAVLARQAGEGFRDVEDDGTLGNMTETYTASNNTTFDLGFATLKNIVAYRHVHNRAGIDLDGSPFPIFNSVDMIRVDQWTEELQLLGDTLDKRLHYILGGFLFKESGHDRRDANISGAPRNNREATGDNRSYSLFGQADFKLTDRFTITGGLRHTWDTRDLTLLSRQNNLTSCRLFDAAGNALSPCVWKLPTADFSAFNYLVTLSYKPIQGVMVYATNSTGYRSGGLNQRASKPGEEGPFGPEKVRNYEVGLKTDLLDHKLTFNVALYYDKYKDIQRALSVSCPNAPATLCTRIVNAASATVKGAEFEVNVRPTRALDLSGFVGLTNAKYNKFINPLTLADLSNNRFSSTPKQTFGATATLTLPVDQSYGDLSFTANFYHQSSETIDDISSLELAGYSLFNLGASWRNVMTKPIDLRIYWNNVLNRNYYTGGVTTFASLGADSRFMGDPSNAGLSISYRF